MIYQSITKDSSKNKNPLSTSSDLNLRRQKDRLQKQELLMTLITASTTNTSEHSFMKLDESNMNERLNHAQKGSYRNTSY